MSAPLVFIRAGTVDYLQAWERQQHLHARRVDDRAPDTVLLLEHLAVYTAGKRTEDYERPADATPVLDVDRGGRITWHGPGQLVGYPIVALAQPLDVVAYVRRLEEALIKVCTDLGVAAGQAPGRSGVWISAEDGGRDRKLAAIGVRVSRGVTMHGFAINCNPDLSAYDRIIACGISDASVTSLSKELGRYVTVDEILPLVESRLEEALSAKLARAA